MTEPSKMTYQETSTLAAEMARWNARRSLLEMFVEPENADIRVRQNEHHQTQDWLREKQHMFDAIVALKALGYEIRKAQ